MNKEELPPVKDAIKIALEKEKRLSHNDLTFLILKDRKLKRYLKNRKDQYENLTKKFFNSEKEKWEFPFHRYIVGSSAIANALDYLQRDNVVKKISGKYELTSPIYKFDAIRALDKAVLSHYPLTDIYQNESPDAGQRRPYVPEPILRVYGMNRKVVEHAEQVDLKDKLLFALDEIERLSLEISQLKDDIGETYKLKLFLEKCKKFNDKKMIEFIQKNLVLFKSIFCDTERLFAKYETAKNGKITWVVDEECLESGLNNITTFPSGIFILGRKRAGILKRVGLYVLTGKDPPSSTEKGRKKKELTSEQIKKIVKAIVKVDRKCKNIYDMDVYPSIMVNECPSRRRSGASFDLYPMVSKGMKLSRKRSGGIFIPLKKRVKK